ncbi:hypothetical protein GW932_00615 [archaeon]|nr:hypothetical protein [archaeon]
MKSVSKMFLFGFLFLFLVSFTCAGDTVNTFLHYEDFSTQSSLTVTQGESVDILSVAYSHDGQFASEKLELVNVKTLFSETKSGTYVTTNTYTYNKKYVLSTTNLNSENYQIRLTVTNLKGEKESSYLTLKVLEKIDTVPVVEIISPTNAQVIEQTPFTGSFSVTDDNLNVCTYKLNSDSVKPIPCSVGLNYINLNLVEGINNLVIYAYDYDGNVGEDSVNFVYQKPITQTPIVEIVSPQNGSYNHTFDEFSFNVNDDNLGICYYRLNGGSIKIVPCSVGITNVVSDVNFVWGENTLTVYAKDLDENIGEDTINFYSDNNYESDSPIVNIIYPLNGSTYSNISGFTFTVYDENLDSCSYEINGVSTSISNCQNGLNTISESITVDGNYELIVHAVDQFGNIGEDSVEFIINSSYVVDLPPIITVITPKNNGKYHNEITFEVSVNENSTVVYSLDGNSNVTMNESGSLHFFSDELDLDLGDHDVTFCATDFGGNTACKTVSFEIVKKKKPCSSTTKVLDDEIEDYQNVDNRPIYLGEDEVVRIEISFGEKIFYGFVTILVLLIGIVMLLYAVEIKRR